jgi:hypothetical protein
VPEGKLGPAREQTVQVVPSLTGSGRATWPIEFYQRKTGRCGQLFGNGPRGVMLLQSILRDVGLEGRQQPTMTLEQYLAQKVAERAAATRPSPAGSEAGVPAATIRDATGGAGAGRMTRRRPRFPAERTASSASVALVSDHRPPRTARTKLPLNSNSYCAKPLPKNTCHAKPGTSKVVDVQ